MEPKITGPLRLCQIALGLDLTDRKNNRITVGQLAVALFFGRNSKLKRMDSQWFLEDFWWLQPFVVAKGICCQVSLPDFQTEN